MGTPRTLRSLVTGPALLFWLLLLLAAAMIPSRAVGQFTSITRNPLGDNGSGFGISWADYDRDGDPDLYVTNDGANLLIRNDGGGNFTDVTAPPLDNPDNGGAA